jgi:alpha-tubulin suppressor-like RCC1 family protein
LSNSPKRVKFPKERVRFITFGKKHAALISESYNLYTFGGGRYGALGHGN